MATAYSFTKPKLILPYYPDDEDDKGYLHIQTYEEKIVSEYLGVSMNVVDTLDVFNFWFYLREAIVYAYSKTEEGREYLEKAWILSQTEPDVKTLRKKFGRRD